MKSLTKCIMVAAMATGMAASAWASSGDIVDIRVVDTDTMRFGARNAGSPKLCSPEHPLVAGDKLCIRVRLLDSNGETAYGSHGGIAPKPWCFQSTGRGSALQNRPKLGLMVGDRPAYAEYSDSGYYIWQRSGTLATDDAGSPDSTWSYFTDLYFTYIVQPGDYGPVTLMNSAGTGPASNADSNIGYYLLNCNAPNTYWTLADEDGTVAKFWYGSEVLPVDWPTGVNGDGPLRNYDLSGEGAFITTCVPVTYLDPTANSGKVCHSYTLYTGQNELSNGWHVVDGSVTANDRIAISGDVHLILKDGASLTASRGVAVGVENNVANSLTLWAQSDGENMGGLKSVGVDNAAGIGGGIYGDGGTVTINGGAITVNGGVNGAGIGGGQGGAGGNVTINGGTVTAIAGAGAGAVGHGQGATDSGSIAFYDTAVVFTNALAQTLFTGDGREGACRGEWARIVPGAAFAPVAYLDPTDEGGHDKTCLNYTIYDGRTSLGRGWYVVTNDVAVDARINVSGDVHLVLCDGASLTANGGINVGAENNAANSLTLWAQRDGDGMGALTAGGGNEQAGIGGGSGQSAGAITVNGGKVTANGGAYGAGIGGGSWGAGGAVTINGGAVTATGGDAGAGIGGAFFGACGAVAVNGGKVTATGGKYAAGIGGGVNGGAGGAAAIAGGLVVAIAGDGAEAIGRSRGGDESVPLSFPGTYRAYSPETSADPVDAANRMDACRGARVKLAPCDIHDYGAYRDNGGTHTHVCKYCSAESTTENHDFVNRVCVCGAIAPPVPFADDDIVLAGYNALYDGAAHGIGVETNAIEGLVLKFRGVAAATGGSPQPSTLNFELSTPPLFTDVTNVTVFVEAAAPGYVTTTNSATVTISPLDLADATVEPIGELAYAGSPLTPAVSVQIAGLRPAAGADYDAAYANNAAPGTATVTLTGKGNYTGTKTATFKIVAPPEPDPPAPDPPVVDPPASEPAPVAATYTVKFAANGGKLPKGKSMAPQKMARGKAYKLRKNKFKRSGYVFAGWSRKKGGPIAFKNAQKVKDLAAAGKAVTLYAAWRRPTYTVKFAANGGTLPEGAKMAPQRIVRGNATRLRENAFTRKGRVFAGWSRRKGGPVAFSDGQKVKNLARAGKTATLHAVWAKPTYRVVFRASGGSGTMHGATFAYGRNEKLPACAFTRDGFRFAGWAKSDLQASRAKAAFRDGQTVKNLTRNGGTVTLYAAWVK